MSTNVTELNNNIDNHSEFHIDTQSKDVFGFWIYILTDIILFGSLFATYLVLNVPGSYGPKLKEHIDLSFVLIETFVLLGSNFTYGLSMLELKKQNLEKTQALLLVTFLLGATFVSMELYEFQHLAHAGYHWQSSGGSAAFFTLVGTHGLHVSAGLVWIIILMSQLQIFKFNPVILKRFIYLGLFWNFLDIVWIFLFSIVYLLGVL